VSRCLAPTIGLLVGLAPALVPALATAQTNIDQGKTPAQIFASDCAVCHKAPRGLANGKNSLMLSGFLREHYTSSRDEAAALAAYVLGAGGGDTGAAAQGRSQKPGQERAREEAKPPIRQARQPVRAEDETPAAKPQRPTDGEVKTDDEAGPDEDRASGAGRRPAAGRNESRPAAAGRGRRKDQEPAPAPAAVVAAPAASAAIPSQDANPASAAAAPAETPPAEGSTVPRDNIPD
jgi:hypothetical protein